jgi:hypothetical protein
VRALWREVRDELSSDADPSAVKETLNAHLTQISDALAQVWSDEALTVTAPDFSALATSLKAAGLPAKVVNALARSLRYSVELDGEQARQVRKSATALNKRQVGRVGQRLNAAMFADPEVGALARRMEENDVPFAYGLRGTLLGGGGGSPFYVLSKVSNGELTPSSSPFEMAQAQMGYTRFLYTKGRWNILGTADSENQDDGWSTAI